MIGSSINLVKYFFFCSSLPEKKLKFTCIQSIFLLICTPFVPSPSKYLKWETSFLAVHQMSIAEVKVEDNKSKPRQITEWPTVWSEPIWINYVPSFSDAGNGGPGEPLAPSPIFGRSVHPIPIGGGQIMSPITIGPQIYFPLPPSMSFYFF